MRAESKRRGRGWLIGLGLALALLCNPGGAAAAEGDQDLIVDHVATYRVDLEGGRIAVEFSYVFENRSAQLEFPGFFESLPFDAVDVTAVSGTTTLDTVRGEPNDGFAPWLVSFPVDLRPGATREVTLSWSIVAGTQGTDTLLVSPGSVAFDAYVGGTPDAVSSLLVVEAPAGFRSLGPTAFVRGDDVAAARYDLAGPDPYVPLPVVLERSSALEAREIVDLPVITARGSVPEWFDLVAEGVAAVHGDLDRWFGPRDLPLEIRQRPAAAGTDPALVESGADPALGTLVLVPVEASLGDLAAELARVWLLDVDVGEEWMIDGLSAAFALETDRTAPSPPVGAAEVVAPLVDQIGGDGVRRVVDALRAGTISYPGAGVEPAVRPADWRHLLDLFENIGGADAAALFRAFVVDPADLAELDRRAAARVDYAALAERAGSWAMPPMLRVPMAGWDFSVFRARQGDVSETLLRRDGLRQWATDNDLRFGSLAGTAFEAATRDMTETDRILDEQEEALEAISEARRLVRGDRGLLAWLGLLGSHPDASLDEVIASWDAGDYAEAVSRAHGLTADVEGAVGRGTLRLVVPGLLLVGLVGFGRALRRRRGRGQLGVSGR